MIRKISTNSSGAIEDEPERCAAAFRALGDPTRLRIFEFLAGCCGPVALEETGEVRRVEGATVGEVWERYIEALCALARGGHVDALAHPDLAKIFGRRPDALTLARLHEQLADAVAESGVAVEISTAGLRKRVGEIYPDEALLRASRAAPKVK